jgi:glycerol uptake facilitator-like aquaporin
MEALDPKSVILELVGTFVVVYVGGWSVQWNYTRMVDIVSASLAQGLTLAIMVYVSLPGSPSHFNPVTTLVALLTGNSSPSAALINMACQFIASILGGLCLKLQSRDLWHGEVKNQLGYPMVTQNTSTVSAFFAELLSSFIYIFAVYAVFYHRQAASGTCATVIGATFIFNSLSIGNMTGCCLNPARVLGPSLFGMGALQPRGGGLFYHVLFMEQNNPDYKDHNLDSLEKIE